MTIPAASVLELLPDALKPLVKIEGGTLTGVLLLMDKEVPVQIVVK